MKFKGDIIITDPCYIMRRDTEGNGNRDDWDKSGYGDNMEVLGIKTFLTSGTEYGDWSCTTVKDTKESETIIVKLNTNYNKLWNAHNNPEGKDEVLINNLEAERKELEDSGKEFILGEFCADAGLVSVFLLSEVLAYNPKFDYHLNKPWTTTLIKDFDGDIEITHRGEGENREVSVVGKGNINFYTTQTGL
jgi:hypothetical protein